MCHHPTRQVGGEDGKAGAAWTLQGCRLAALGQPEVQTRGGGTPGKPLQSQPGSTASRRAALPEQAGVYSQPGLPQRGREALAYLAPFPTPNLSAPKLAVNPRALHLHCLHQFTTAARPLAGLRALQAAAELEALMRAARKARDAQRWGPGGPPPLRVKIAPDLTDADLADIAAAALRSGVDGLVVSNTTITRPGGIADAPHGSEVRRRCASGRQAGAGAAAASASARFWWWLGLQVGPGVGTPPALPRVSTLPLVSSTRAGGRPERRAPVRHVDPRAARNVPPHARAAADRGSGRRHDRPPGI
jgi:hypothetical protein